MPNPDPQRTKRRNPTHGEVTDSLNQFTKAGAPREQSFEPQDHGLAELGGAYKTDLNDWEKAGSGSVPSIARSSVLPQPATRVTLSPLPKTNQQIVWFERSKGNGEVLVAFGNPVDKLQVVKRRATELDRRAYPKQWHAFEESEKQFTMVKQPR